MALYHKLIAESTAFHSDPKFLQLVGALGQALSASAGAEAQAKTAQVGPSVPRVLNTALGTVDAALVKAAEP